MRILACLSSASLPNFFIIFCEEQWHSVCQSWYSFDIFPQSLDNITPPFLKSIVTDKFDLHLILLPSSETTLETTKLFSLNLNIWQIPVLCLYICIYIYFFLLIFLHFSLSEATITWCTGNHTWDDYPSFVSIAVINTLGKTNSKKICSADNSRLQSIIAGKSRQEPEAENHTHGQEQRQKTSMNAYSQLTFYQGNVAPLSLFCICPLLFFFSLF